MDRTRWARAAFAAWFFGVLTMISLAGAPSALACSCDPFDVHAALEQADGVYLAQTTEEIDGTGFALIETDLEVSHVFKGAPIGRVAVSMTVGGDGACGVDDPNGSMVVVAKAGETTSLNLCSQISASTARDVLGEPRPVGLGGLVEPDPEPSGSSSTVPAAIVVLVVAAAVAFAVRNRYRRSA